MSVNEKMTAIADSIRSYGNISGKLNLDEMANKIGTVYLNGYDLGRVQGEEAGFEEGRKKGYSLGFEEGKIAERDAFWDVFQNNGLGTRYNWCFAYANFKDSNYNPKYTIKGSNVASALQSAFYSTSITDTKVPIDATVCKSLDSTFYWARVLKRIAKIIVNEETTANNTTFNDCSALEEIEIEGTIGQNGYNWRWSTLLNKASIESIINALSATTSGLTVTFSKTAVNNAFTAEEWDALEATKTNWTISLV